MTLHRNPQRDTMTRQAIEHLEHLKELWIREQRTTHARFVAERRDLTLAQRVERGLALRDLAIDDTDAAPGGRTLLWLVGRSDPSAFEDLRIGVGDPVRLWIDDPDGPDAVLATVARRRIDRLAVMIDGELPERLESDGFRLDRDEPQATFERGLRAIHRFRDATTKTDEHRLRAIFYGDQSPIADTAPDPWQPLDTDLNPAQLHAIDRALATLDIALIHGPPGTGKTRTLVEVIRQAVARGERILATAASNTAVDNLAERLCLTGLAVVRLGHPARVSADMEPFTLDAMLEQTDAYTLSRRWIAESNALRRRAHNRFDRGSIGYRERRELLSEANRLFRDARRHLDQARLQILDRAQVICATAAGADTTLLGRTRFDLVVLDEATQAPDPIALVPLSRAAKAVLAGDPRQLPPTVIDPQVEREGLGVSLFERLAEQHPTLPAMLTVQHRMHENLMRYPSESMYDGALTAASHVAQHTLTDLDVALDPLRPGPLVFIDTAGKGWEEVHTADDPSTRNPDHATRTAQEARRLLGRGLPPTDLAIITPYYAQVRLLRDLLGDLTLQGLDIGTIDGFQGREKEAILIDLVRSNPDGNIGFLADTRRMNVAITRARRALIIVGDSST
ncbi:MAG: AAA domain-containing protein, partial [Myxococcota bacterium]